MASHPLTIVVDGVDLQSDAGANALFIACCGDATSGQVNGVQYVEFDREALTLDHATQSAVSDLRRVDGLEVVAVLTPRASSRATDNDRKGD